MYVRGEAYLAAGQGTQAAAEFQKILDHSAYKDFLTLWKDADPEIPILKPEASQSGVREVVVVLDRSN